MRKYLIFVISCIVFLVSSFGQAYAADLNDPCSSDDSFPGDICEGLLDPAGCQLLQDMKCTPGLYCQGEELRNGFKRNGFCKEKQTLPEKRNLTCACLASGQGKAQQNGFTCTDDATGQLVRVLPGRTADPDLNVAYCEQDEYCFTRPGAPHEPTHNGAPHPYGVPADYALKGVSCTREKQANCRCENINTSGGGKNRIYCVSPASNVTAEQMTQRTGPKQADEVETYCYDDGQACNPQPGVAEPDTIASDPFLREGNPRIRGEFAGARLAGVRCTAPEVQCRCMGTPNQKGSGINSIRCEKPGQPPAEGWCKNEDACVPDGRINESEIDRLTDGLLNDGITGSNEDSYRGVDLLGVRCSASAEFDPPPLPPVPPPPCADGKLINGLCTGFNTAFGVIETNSGPFFTRVIALVLAASGAFAVLLFMRSGYIIMTSAGNPERVKSGREQFIAAFFGLLFILFSFVIFEVIGIEILRLPGFTADVQPGAGNNPGVAPPDHCLSCETAAACNARGGSSRGTLDCANGFICCE